MKHQTYAHSPRRTRAVPSRRRRQVRKRRGASPILRLAGLFSLSMAALVLFVKVFGNTDIGATDSAAAADTYTSSAAPSVRADKADSIAAGDSMLNAEDEVPSTDAEYDFSLPVPASDPVEDSYFNDAVFIGDSRTEGLILSTGLSNAVSYAHKGLMVDTVFTNPVINKEGQKISVMDALKSTSFSKVYIMLGLNETGWVYSQVFQKKYGEIIDGIREINPEAIIYIQEIMPVSNKVSAAHSYITNAKIEEYNGLLRELAEEKQVYYIDTGHAVASADGSLPEDAAVDGIHLVKDYCEKWLSYIKTHTAAQ